LLGRKGRGEPAPDSSEPVSPQQAGTVGLFVSILVRYPEVATVTYRRDTHSVKLTFLVRSALSAKRVASFRALVEKSVRVYTTLRRRTVRLMELEARVSSPVSVLEMRRDIESLTQGELSMILALAAEAFGKDLVVDRLPDVEHDELAAQEELIEEMLEDLRESPHEPNLIAFREEGRVLVFNQ